MLNKNIETFIGCDNEYGESGLVIFGAPFDSTTSFRPGTRFASKTMRSESFGIETYSPYQDKDLEDIAVFDGGDLELSFGNTEKALTQIEQFTAKVLEDDKIPCMIGGEHLVTLGAIRAVAKNIQISMSSNSMHMQTYVKTILVKRYRMPPSFTAFGTSLATTAFSNSASVQEIAVNSNGDKIMSLRTSLTSTA